MVLALRESSELRIPTVEALSELMAFPELWK